MYTDTYGLRSKGRVSGWLDRSVRIEHDFGDWTSEGRKLQGFVSKDCGVWLMAELQKLVERFKDQETHQATVRLAVLENF